MDWFLYHRELGHEKVNYIFLALRSIQLLFDFCNIFLKYGDL